MRTPHWEHRPGRGWPGRRPKHPFVLAAVVALVQIIGCSIAASRGQPETRALDALGYALLAAGPLALVVRRRRPALTLVATVAVAAAYFTLGYPSGPGFLAALVALLGAVRSGHRVTSWVAGGLAYVTWVLAGRLWPGLPLARPALGHAVLVAAWLLVAYALAEAARVRSAHFAEMMRARAERERAAEEHERRQASEERLRIARELHDVLGHHLSLINVQAGVGLHLMDQRPEQARAALTAIKQASAEALREVRGVLSALRTEGESAPRAPAPALSGGAGQAGPNALVAGLNALVAEVTAAGLAVQVQVTGERRPLPAEVDRAAYRIVQEALTNVRRHAGPGAHAAVSVAYAPGTVEVRVVDDGVGVPSADGAETRGAAAGDEVRGADAEAVDAGSGIAGMRERAATLGGELTAGPRAAGGFEVYARLPTTVGEES